MGRMAFLGGDLRWSLPPPPRAPPSLPTSDGGGERDGDPAAAAAAAATGGSPPLDGGGGDWWLVRARCCGGEEPTPPRGGDAVERRPPLCPADGGICASRLSSTSCSGRCYHRVTHPGTRHLLDGGRGRGYRGTRRGVVKRTLEASRGKTFDDGAFFKGVLFRTRARVGLGNATRLTKHTFVSKSISRE